MIVVSLVLNFDQYRKCDVLCRGLPRSFNLTARIDILLLQENTQFSHTGFSTRAPAAVIASQGRV